MTKVVEVVCKSCGRIVAYIDRVLHDCKCVTSLSVLCSLCALANGCDHEWPQQRIVGMYSVPDSMLATVAGSGFTHVQNYDFQTKTYVDGDQFARVAGRYLDAAHEQGLKVMLGFPRAWVTGRNGDNIRSAVCSLTTHAALGAWYVEELMHEDRGAVVWLDSLIHKIDPEHGLWVEDFILSPDTWDTGANRVVTYYPNRDDRATLWPLAQHRRNVDSLRVPLQVVLQAFTREHLDHNDPVNYTTPTLKDLRYAADQARAHGAVGIWFYSFQQPTRFDDSLPGWPWRDYRPLPEVFPELWADVVTVAGEW